jgi:hypothetical protein
MLVVGRRCPGGFLPRFSDGRDAVAGGPSGRCRGSLRTVSTAAPLLFWSSVDERQFSGSDGVDVVPIVLRRWVGAVRAVWDMYRAPDL